MESHPDAQSQQTSIQSIANAEKSQPEDENVIRLSDSNENQQQTFEKGQPEQLESPARNDQDTTEELSKFEHDDRH